MFLVNHYEKFGFNLASEALRAHEQLKNDGIYTRIIDCYSVKPLDRTTFQKAYEENGLFLTVEDHFTQGGLEEAIASIGLQPRILAGRLQPPSGLPEKLLAEQGIDANGILTNVKESIATEDNVFPKLYQAG
jgi:transketolase